LSHYKNTESALPKIQGLGDLYNGCVQEKTYRVSFPYTIAGLYPFKEQAKIHADLFAGEGGPERNPNRRFSLREFRLTPASDFSTAFDLLP